MRKKRIILVSAVYFSIAVFAVQTLSQTRNSNRPPIRKMGPDSKRLQGLSKEEVNKEIKKWFAQRRQQRLKEGEERMRLMAREVWKRLLRVTEQQWKLIEPKYEKVRDLRCESRVCVLGSGGSNKQSFHWKRRTKGTDGIRAKTLDEMTEGEKIVEEIIDLLENENAKDEEIRKKMDALQRAREKARKELPKAKQELKEVLTTPRQEAVFLLLGTID